MGDIPSPPPSLKDSPITRMRAYLFDKLHAGNEPNRSFWCEEDLRLLWSNEQLADEILGFESRIDLKHAQQRYFKILSILIHTQTFDAEVFKTEFFNTSGRTNEDLPFTRETLSKALRSQVDGQFFYEAQFLTIPIFIEDEENATIKTIERGRRWPFEDIEEPIGIGGYGTVFRARVPPRYIRNLKHRTSNDTSRFIAFKRLHRPADGTQEVRNTNFLKEGLASHSAISIHIAALIQGSEFFIFFDYAEYGNLETFLTQGSSHEDDRLSYDFPQRFPKFTAPDLLGQMKGILGALKFLHNELQIKDNPRTYCRHMDLRPSNILIFPGGNVGTWKLSDFGISVFKSHVKALKDLVTPSEHASETPINLLGPHFAPELHPYYVEKISDTKSDVWSWGCILIEVLAFALGGGLAVHQFRDHRYEGNDDWFYRVSERREEHDNRSTDLFSDTKRFLLKPKIKQWIEELQVPPGLDVRKLRGYQNLIINGILVPNFHRRFTSAEIWNSIDQVELHQDSLRLTTPAIFKPGSWSLRLPQSKVIHWDLSSNGESAAFLFQEEVLRFQIDSRQNSNGVRERHHLDLSNLGMVQMKVAGPCTLVIVKVKNGKHESWLGDMSRSHTPISIPLDPVDHLADCNMFDLSCRGILGLVYLDRREVRLLDIRSNFVVTQIISIDQPHNVDKIAFNATGRLLNVWTRAGCKSDKIHIYEVYERAAGDRALIQPLSSTKIQVDHSPGLATRLIPCYSESILVVTMDDGKIFLPQVIEGEPNQAANPQQLEFSDPPLQFVATDFALIVLCKKKKVFGKSSFFIQERPFIKERGRFAISSAKAVWRSENDSTWTTKIQNARMAVQDSDGRQVLVLCNASGEVSRLSRSFL